MRGLNIYFIFIKNQNKDYLYNYIKNISYIYYSEIN